jgi:pimeloyl-ACP methyl ester carboxylesterase
VFQRLSASFVALAGVLVLLPVTTLAGGASASLASSVATSTRVTGANPRGLSAWKKCANRLECAVLRVPADYARPDGEQVGIAVIRQRATEPSRRIGSLVANFGGPGDAGTTTLPDFAGSVPAEIRARYDIVSFDPRGTGKSRPIDCVDDKTADALNAVDPTPNRDTDLLKFYNGTNYPVDLVAQCVARTGSWLAEVGSRNVARDLDRLRAALGDSRLTYLGYSYGTVIGAVYAQMFPPRVGHLVLDSPVNLSSTAIQELRGDAAGFENALDQFLADCARRSRCIFHSNGNPAAALRSLQARFEQGLTLPATTATGRPSRRRVGVAAFYTAVIASLYDKRYGWPTLAEGLRLAQEGDGSVLQIVADDYNGRHDNGTYDNVNEAIGVILCDDRSDAVPSFADYVSEYHRDRATYPFLGSYVGSSVLGCDPRLRQPPAAEAVGDVRVAGTRPILVVGTTKDPATPYAGAQDLTMRIAGSRLLTFDSTEHTAYTKNGCIDRAVDAYLINDKLPPAGKECAGSGS